MNHAMKTLFQPTTLKSLSLPNRLVRSATWEGMCDPDGRPTEKLCNYMQPLAEGGVGLIISSYSYVRPDGKQNHGQMGIYTDAFADDFKQMTHRVHAGGGRIAIQLVHAGGQARSKIAGRQPLAPSAVETPQFGEIPKELSTDQIDAIVTAFAMGARRAKAWGFDGVQLHGAHGYLINQFLSPLTNRRSDLFGGGIENRHRFLMAVFGAIRSEVGREFPVMIKLNAADHVEGGLTADDAEFAARRLDDAGIDAIEVSSGTAVSKHLGPTRNVHQNPRQGGLQSGSGPPHQSRRPLPGDGGGRISFPGGGGTGHKPGGNGLYRHVSPPDPGARPAQTLARGGPTAGDLHLVQRVLQTGAQGGGHLLRPGEKRKGELMQSLPTVFVIGEILFDVFPAYTRMGGAPP